MSLSEEEKEIEKTFLEGRYSYALNELRNLYLAAEWHKTHCAMQCDVSLRLLKMTAKRLLQYVWPNEKEAAAHIISKWPEL